MIYRKAGIDETAVLSELRKQQIIFTGEHAECKCKKVKKYGMKMQNFGITPWVTNPMNFTERWFVQG